MKRRHGFNPKRKIAPAGTLSDAQLKDLSERIGYGGNPEHKKYPNDYGLTPATSPRPGKTLCDAKGIFSKAHAVKILKAGLDKGLISVCRVGEWPQNIWATSESGELYEAQLENKEKGTYHGYPLPGNDEFRSTVKKEWERR